MKYFYDTEFIEDGKTIDLISIGIVAEDGRELYLENSEADWSKADDWVKKNVLPHLLSYRPMPDGYTRSNCEAASRETMRQLILEFIGSKEIGWTATGERDDENPKPELWGYYSAYDHVALCQLFGQMVNLPKGWPMYTRDIKQLCDSLGNPTLPEQGKGEHHALADARWNKAAWEFLQRLMRDRPPQ